MEMASPPAAIPTAADPPSSAAATPTPHQTANAAHTYLSWELGLEHCATWGWDVVRPSEGVWPHISVRRSLAISCIGLLAACSRWALRRAVDACV
jgi:hypothetical protein